jgi:hypothetical protein
MKQFLAVLAVLAASVVWPALSSAATFKGVVVAKERGTLLVAWPNGNVAAVSGRASVGARVAVSGRSVRVVGHASRAVVRGVVVGRNATTMFLSAGRHLLAVRTGRHTASVSVQQPASPVPTPGHVISATLHISGGGGLDEESEDDLGPAPGVSVQATVTAVAPGSVTLTVNGQTLTVPLPAGMTLPATLVGQQITFQLSFPGGQTQVSAGGSGPSIGGQPGPGDDDGGDGGGGGGDNGGGDG